MRLGATIYIYRERIDDTFNRIFGREAGGTGREFDGLTRLLSPSLRRYLFVVRDVLSGRALIDFWHKILVLSPAACYRLEKEATNSIWKVL